MQYTLITGACGGLGGAFVEELVLRGENLLLTGRSEERLSALKQDILSRASIEVEVFACDLTSEHERAALFQFIDEKQIVLNRLIYVAGVDTQMAFEKYDEGRILMQTRTNFEGAVSLLRGVIARAPMDGSTELLTIGSVSGLAPMPYFALYSATKKALEQFCSALRTELKGRAKVTCVLPGGIPTREDIKENIRSHGFFGKISAKSPRAVARASLKAVKRNKRKKIIGFWNRFINFFSALCPTPLRMKIIARMWRRTEKDYFAPKPQ